MNNYPNSVHQFFASNPKNPPPKPTSAKIPLTLGAGHQKLTLKFLWVVLWVKGVLKTHKILIK
jgi:hypothetical protein